MRLLLPLLLLWLAAPPAQAHPHVWIEASLGTVWEGKTLVAFEVTWRFDDLYSDLVQQDFDLDGDGMLSPQELDALVGISAVNLISYSFFTHLKVGGERLPVQAVQEFYAEVVDGLVEYRFRVPLPAPVDPHTTPVAIGLFDETYYVDLLLTAGDIALDPASGCTASLQQDLAEPLYFGSFYPTYVVLECAGG